MAHHDASHGGHPAMDYAEHERTYAAFTTMTKWGTITVATILVLMAIFLV
ncbi:aa3-type cytochrome c oxidase subunit IV [Alsobacter sp. R-9]